MKKINVVFALVFILPIVFSMFTMLPMFAPPVKAEDWQASQPIDDAVQGASRHHSGNSFYGYLAYRWAPVWKQNTDKLKPQADYIVAFNYDGNWDATDNWDNLWDGDLSAFIYYSVVETDTHWFIGYYAFHPRDWDSPEGPDPDEHENDMEGALLVVEKTWGYGSLILIETLAHGDFYQYSNLPIPDGTDDVDDYIYSDDFDGFDHPILYVESGGHGVYGSWEDAGRLAADDWPNGAFPGGDGVVYYPTGIAEIPESGNDRNVGYVLIDIEELWKRRRWGELFDKFGEFAARDQDSGAKAPWRWDDWNDGPTFTGEFFYNPADMVNIHLDMPEPFKHKYTYNPYAVEVVIDGYWIHKWADVKSYADPYITLYMIDGRGRKIKVMGAGHASRTGWSRWRFPVKGSQSNWQGWNIPPTSVTDINLVTLMGRNFFYGIRYPNKPYFGIRCRDRDGDPDEESWEDNDEWLMDKKYTHWYGPPGSPSYVGVIYDGWRTYQWGGSTAKISVVGDVVDDDTEPPEFSNARTDPVGFVYSSFYRGSISFTIGISDESGVYEAKFRYNGTNTPWSDWRQASRVQGTWDSTYTVFSIELHRNEWTQLEGQTIYYQWSAVDNDNDRPGDRSRGESETYRGPKIAYGPTGTYPSGSDSNNIIAFQAPHPFFESYIGYVKDGELTYGPVGERPSVSGDIIAYQTNETWVNQDLNYDGDTNDLVIQYYNISEQGGLPYTVEVGMNPSISGNIIAYQSGSVIKYCNISEQGLPKTVEMGENPSVSGDIIAFEEGSVIKYYNVSASTPEVINTYAVGENPSVSGDIIAFETPEAIIGMDLSGDGSPNDVVIRYYDISNSMITNTGAIGLNPSVGYEGILFQTNESDIGVDVNNDGDTNDWVIRGYINGDVRDPIRVGEFPCSTSPKITLSAGALYVTISGVKMAFQIDEAQVGMDLNGDEDINDYVIGALIRDNTKVGVDVPVVADFEIARAEEAAEFLKATVEFAEVISPGITDIFRHKPDRALPPLPYGRTIVGVPVDITTTAEYSGSIKISISYDPALVMDEENLRLFELDTNTMQWNDITIGIDLDRNMLFGQVPELHSTFAVMEWTGVTPSSTVAVGGYPSLDRNIIAFHTYEAEVNLDLNGDGDTGDFVIQYYDLSTGTTTNTGEVGVYPSVNGDIIAFQTNETWVNRDLNHDGDTKDAIIRYYNITKPLGLISWWPGDEHAYDIINENHGTLMNTTTFAPGKVGQAFSFDGIDDYVWAPGTGIDDLQQLTIEAWVKLNSLPDRIQRFVTLAPPGLERAVLRYQGFTEGPQQLHFYMRIGNETTDFTHLTVDNVLQAGVWHHVAGTYDGNYMRLYLDGVEVASLQISGPIATGTDQGVRFSSPDEPLDGLLDEVGIYSRALDASEIQAIYKAGIAGKPKPAFADTIASGQWPSVDGDIIAFHTNEGIVAMDLNGDGDTNDNVIRYYNIITDTVTNIGIAGAVPFANNNTIAFYTDEAWAHQDLNGDNDTNDRVLRYYDVSTGILTNTGAILEQTFTSMDNNIIAFTTSEGWIGQDLNGDGDIEDKVIRYYDTSTGTTINTGAVGSSPSISGNLITFITRESMVNKDLNHDGDKSDSVLRYYDISTGDIINTAEASGHPSIYSNIIAFPTLESMINLDFNGDNDTNDHVIRYVTRVIPQPLLPPTSAIDLITAPLGGTVTNAEATASVEIPPGALSEDTTIAINPVPLSEYGDFLIQNQENIVSTEVYELSLNGATLTEPATITLAYNETQVDETQIQQLRVFSSEDNINYQPQRITRVDTTLNTVSFLRFRFSYFVIIRDNQPATTELTTGTPQHIDEAGNTYVTSTTKFTLAATDNLPGNLYTYYRINNSIWTLYQAPFNLTGPDGTYTIDYFTIDFADNREAFKSTTVFLDTTPPTTTISLSGTSGLNGWFKSDVTVTLTATDSLSGISKTEYSFDGVVWITYEAPFTLTTEGNTTIYYKSIDNMGNMEDPPKTTTVKIDKTPPETTISLSDALGNAGWHTSDVTVTLTATDTISGVAVVEYSFDGANWFTYINPLTINTEGITTVYARTTDTAGNTEDPPEIVVVRLDKTSPTTGLTMGTHFVNDAGNIYVTSATEFSLTATDVVSGIAHTYYRINDGEWCEYVSAFTLAGLDGVYTIDYYSVDVAGNEESFKSETVILTSLKVESYLTDSEFNPVTYFDVIFSKDRSGGYKLVATNPGQFYYNINVSNNWPIAVDTLTINAEIPMNFTLKGAVPIHVYLDGVDITDTCTIDGTTITITNIPAGSEVYITIHIDYALKGTIYTSPDEFGLKDYTFTVTVEGSGLATGGSLTGTYTSSATLIAHQKKTTAIAGFITDADGNPIAGATVKLYDSNNDLVGETVTDENGFYYFLDIEAGDYTIEVTYNGQTCTQTTTVAKGELTQVNFKIE